MAEFLVEAYAPRNAGRVLPPAADEVSAAAADVRRSGSPIRLVRSIFVPEDEVCFFLFNARSMDAVHTVATRAGLCLQRVSEVISAE